MVVLTYDVFVYKVRGYFHYHSRPSDVPYKIQAFRLQSWVHSRFLAITTSIFCKYKFELFT